MCNDLQELQPGEFGLSRLAIPMPTSLEVALGWARPARYFGGWWEPAGDELTLSDGRVTTDAVQWFAWRLYTEHPAIWPHLADLDLGDSDEQAHQVLIFDRVARTVWAADRESGAQWLTAQWSYVDPAARGAMHMSQDDLARIARAQAAALQAISPAEVQRKREAEHAAFDRLRRELDEWAAKQ